MSGFLPYVLVVDDCRDSADSTAQMLSLWGYDSKPHYAGASALAAVRVRRPALVLLDIAMYPMNGYEFVSLFRKVPGCGRTATIALTGITSEISRQRSRELGIAHYLFKPADPVLLRGLIVGLLAECEPRPRNRALPNRQAPAFFRASLDTLPYANAATEIGSGQYANSDASVTI